MTTPSQRRKKWKKIGELYEVEITVPRKKRAVKKLGEG